MLPRDTEDEYNIIRQEGQEQALAQQMLQRMREAQEGERRFEAQQQYVQREALLQEAVNYCLYQEAMWCEAVRQQAQNHGEMWQEAIRQEAWRQEMLLREALQRQAAQENEVGQQAETSGQGMHYGIPGGEDGVQYPIRVKRELEEDLEVVEVDEEVEVEEVRAKEGAEDEEEEGGEEAGEEEDQDEVVCKEEEEEEEDEEEDEDEDEDGEEDEEEDEEDEEKEDEDEEDDEEEEDEEEVRVKEDEEGEEGEEEEEVEDEEEVRVKEEEKGDVKKEMKDEEEVRMKEEEEEEVRVKDEVGEEDEEEETKDEETSEKSQDLRENYSTDPAALIKREAVNNEPFIANNEGWPQTPMMNPGFGHGHQESMVNFANSYGHHPERMPNAEHIKPEAGLEDDEQESSGNETGTEDDGNSTEKMAQDSRESGAEAEDEASDDGLNLATTNKNLGPKNENPSTMEERQRISGHGMTGSVEWQSQPMTLNATLSEHTRPRYMEIHAPSPAHFIPMRPPPMLQPSPAANIRYQWQNPPWFESVRAHYMPLGEQGGIIDQERGIGMGASIMPPPMWHIPVTTMDLSEGPSSRNTLLTDNHFQGNGIHGYMPGNPMPSFYAQQNSVHGVDLPPDSQQGTSQFSMTEEENPSRPHMQTEQCETPQNIPGPSRVRGNASRKIMLTCPNCQLKFGSHESLRGHMRAHALGHQFTCEHCGQLYHTISSLKTHYRVHSDNKPYTCKTCQKSFTHKSNLLSHQKSHWDSVGFRCALCGERFESRSICEVHFHTCHSDQAYIPPMPPLRRMLAHTPSTRESSSVESDNGSPGPVEETPEQESGQRQENTFGAMYGPTQGQQIQGSQTYMFMGPDGMIHEYTPGPNQGIPQLPGKFPYFFECPFVGVARCIAGQYPCQGRLFLCPHGKIFACFHEEIQSMCTGNEERFPNDQEHGQ